RRPRRRRQALLRFGLIAEEPVVGRMSPEVFGAGLVFLQRPVLLRLLLRAGETCTARDKADGRKRKQGFVETRFHKSLPMQPEGRTFFVLEMPRGELLESAKARQTSKMLAHPERVRSAGTLT